MKSSFKENLKKFFFESENSKPNRLNWSYSGVFLALVIFYVIALGLDIFSNKETIMEIAIGGLLLFIGFEIFFIRVSFFEDIKNEFKDIKNEMESIAKKIDRLKPDIAYTDNRINRAEKISKAKSSIFVSGIGMGDFRNDNEDFIKSIETIMNQGVRVHCIACDLNVDEVRKCSHFINKTDDLKVDRDRTGFDECIKTIKSWECSTDFFKDDFIDYFTQVSYFAVDYDVGGQSTFIEATYFSANVGIRKKYYCHAYPGTDLYEYYKKQIDFLKGKANGEKTNG
ncbi:MAG: hypothetical protein LBC82_05875 [Oscillospiraceae bacterium]|jgi:hypothetical protein|nr:hypothetical protein [Oscillospiraceae bacterium]